MQASKSAISQARTRLGSQVIRHLAERVLRPLAAPGAPGAWYRGLRVMALDGSCMDVADEAANAEYFGYPGASRGQSAFPQARLLRLVECGTHVVTAAEVAPYGHSEQAMAAQMLPAKLRPDMLVLADRNFYGFKLWQLACASGAKLAWRVKSNQAALNHERCEIEGVFDEFKTHPARQQHGAAQQDARSGAARAVGVAAGALRHPPADGASRVATRARPRSLELHARCACDQAQDAASCGCPPLSVCLHGAIRCSRRSHAADVSAAGGASIHAASSAR